MKHKSLIIVFLLFVTLCTCNSAFSQGTNIEFEDTEQSIDIDSPIAQSAPEETNANFQSENVIAPIPITEDQKDFIDQYGLVAFAVVTSLGLVVFIVRSDRTTMQGLITSIQQNAQATEHHAKATEKLSQTMENKIEVIHMDLKTRLKNLEKVVDKAIDKLGTA